MDVDVLVFFLNSLSVLVICSFLFLLLNNLFDTLLILYLYIIVNLYQMKDCKFLFQNCALLTFFSLTWFLGVHHQ